MYAEEKTISFAKEKYKLTKGSLVKALEPYDDDTEIIICGDDRCFMHVEEDNSTINLDTEELGNIQ